MSHRAPTENRTVIPSKQSLRELLTHLQTRNRAFWIPFVLALILATLLLLATQTAATVAPFVYAIF